MRRAAGRRPPPCAGRRLVRGGRGRLLWRPAGRRGISLGRAGRGDDGHSRSARRYRADGAQPFCPYDLKEAERRWRALVGGSAGVAGPGEVRARRAARQAKRLGSAVGRPLRMTLRFMAPPSARRATVTRWAILCGVPGSPGPEGPPARRPGRDGSTGLSRRRGRNGPALRARGGTRLGRPGGNQRGLVGQAGAIAAQAKWELQAPAAARIPAESGLQVAGRVDAHAWLAAWSWTSCRA